jgi:predicted kinase
MSTAPILHLICGLPGSGKTTVARKIESSTGAIRFCPDEWIKDIWKEKAEDEGNNLRDAIETLQWKIARRVLQNNIDVIIEWGTWGRNEREKLRDDARSVGARVKFYYLDVPKNTLYERIIARNKDLGEHEFHLPDLDVKRLIDEWYDLFQEPTAEELQSYDILVDP